MRNITINTDASFCPFNRVGGYAFYIVCDDFKIQKSGILKSVNCSGQAELQAIANSVHMLLNTKKFRVENIIINTDYKPAIYKVSNKYCKVSKLIKGMLNTLKNQTGAKDWEIRHVRAHTGKNDARSWVNEWCDREAKIKMKIARKKVKN